MGNHYFHFLLYYFSNNKWYKQKRKYFQIKLFLFFHFLVRREVLFAVLLLSALCNARASHCSAFSCCGAQTRCGLQSLVHRLSCSRACGIFLGQGLNPCPLHWQVDILYPLGYQGSPKSFNPSLLKQIWKYREMFLLRLVSGPHLLKLCTPPASLVLP